MTDSEGGVTNPQQQQPTDQPQPSLLDIYSLVRSMKEQQDQTAAEVAQLKLQQPVHAQLPQQPSQLLPSSGVGSGSSSSSSTEMAMDEAEGKAAEAETTARSKYTHTTHNAWEGYEITKTKVDHHIVERFRRGEQGLTAAQWKLLEDKGVANRQYEEGVEAFVFPKGVKINKGVDGPLEGVDERLVRATNNFAYLCEMLTPIVEWCETGTPEQQAVAKAVIDQATHTAVFLGDTRRSITNLRLTKQGFGGLSGNLVPPGKESIFGEAAVEQADAAQKLAKDQVNLRKASKRKKSPWGLGGGGGGGGGHSGGGGGGGGGGGNTNNNNGGGGKGGGNNNAKGGGKNFKKGKGGKGGGGGNPQKVPD